MVEAYPLHWPDGWPRTQRPGSSQFRTSIAERRQLSINELIGDVDSRRQDANLSSALRLEVLESMKTELKKATRHG